MKMYAITEGDMFLQRFDVNEEYKRDAKAIQSNPHDHSEFTPIFGREEKWFDCRTATGYMQSLIEHARWDDRRHITFGLIVKRDDQ